MNIEQKSKQRTNMITYPHLGVTFDEVIGSALLLFHARNCGIVLESDISGMKSGDYFDNMDATKASYYLGEVTLSNEGS